MPQASDIDSVKRPGQTVVQPLAVVTRGPTEALLGRLPIDRPIGAVAEEKPRQGGHDLISSLAVASSMSCLPARPWCSSRPASCSPAEQDPTYRGSFSQRRHRRRHPSGHHSPRCPGCHGKTVERCRISTRPVGCYVAVKWARRFRTVKIAGVEGTSSYGAGLTR
jgi:hypothetical protein